MRVLFFGDYPNRVGGAQKSLLAALERIGHHGIDAVLVFPAHGPFQELCAERGIDVRVIEGARSFNTFGKVLLNLSPADLLRVTASELAPYWVRLARFAKEIGAEAMHFNTPRGLLMAGPAVHLAGLGSVFHQRGTPGLGRTIWFLSQAVPDRIVIVSKTVYDYLAPSAHGRTRLVYNGIDPPPPIDPGSARLALVDRLNRAGFPINADEKLFASLSAIVPFKGIHHLVEGAKRAANHGVRPQYLLASAGTDEGYETWLKQRIAEYGLTDRFHFIGLVDRIHELLSGVDAMLLTSIVGRETFTYDDTTVQLTGCEGLPRSILESLAAGTPVIATDGGGVREQIDQDSTGLIVPPANTVALGDAIIELASRESCCRDSRARGPMVVKERFSIDQAARGLAETLLEVRKTPSLSERVPAMASLISDAVRAAT
ncbi:MAG: glycosyltransferase family 4 protein [Polyangiaceae bacterium]|nr:glycosyltransferase family 4 protein [Polyangiaceae bacterium]